MTHSVPQPNLAESLSQRFVHTPLVISRLQNIGVGSRALQWSQSLFRPFIQPSRSLSFPEQSLTLIARIRRKALPEILSWPRSRAQALQAQRSGLPESFEFSSPPFAESDALPLLQSAHSTFSEAPVRLSQASQAVPVLRRVQRSLTQSLAPSSQSESMTTQSLDASELQAWPTIDQQQTSFAKSVDHQSSSLVPISSPWQTRSFSSSIARMFRASPSQAVPWHAVSGLSLARSLQASLLHQPASSSTVSIPFAVRSDFSYADSQMPQVLLQSVRDVSSARSGFSPSQLPLVLRRSAVNLPSIPSLFRSSSVSRVPSISDLIHPISAQAVQSDPVSVSSNQALLQPSSVSEAVPSVPMFSLDSVQQQPPSARSYFEPDHESSTPARVQPIHRSSSFTQVLSSASLAASMPSPLPQSVLRLADPSLTALAVTVPWVSRSLLQPARLTIAHKPSSPSPMAVFRSFVQASSVLAPQTSVVSLFPNTGLSPWNTASLPLVMPSRPQAVHQARFGDQSIARAAVSMPVSGVPNVGSQALPMPVPLDLPRLHSNVDSLQRVAVPFADNSFHSSDRLSMAAESISPSVSVLQSAAVPQTLSPHLPLLQRANSFEHAINLHSPMSSMMLARLFAPNQSFGFQSVVQSAPMALPSLSRTTSLPGRKGVSSASSPTFAPVLPLVQAFRSDRADISRSSTPAVLRAHRQSEVHASLHGPLIQSESHQPISANLGSLSLPLDMIARSVTYPSFVQRTQSGSVTHPIWGSVNPFIPHIARSSFDMDMMVLPNNRAVESSPASLPLVQLIRAVPPSTIQRARSQTEPSSRSHVHANSAFVPNYESSSFPVLARSLVQGSQSLIQRLIPSLSFVEPAQASSVGRSSAVHPASPSLIQSAFSSQQVASIPTSQVLPLPLIQAHRSSIHRSPTQFAATVQASSVGRSSAVRPASPSPVYLGAPPNQVASIPASQVLPLPLIQAYPTFMQRAAAFPTSISTVQASSVGRSSAVRSASPSAVQSASPFRQVASIPLTQVFTPLPLIQAYRSLQLAQQSDPQTQRLSQAGLDAQSKFQTVPSRFVAMPQAPAQRVFDAMPSSMSRSPLLVQLERISSQQQVSINKLIPSFGYSDVSAGSSVLSLIQPFHSMSILQRNASTQSVVSPATLTQIIPVQRYSHSDASIQNRAASGDVSYLLSSIPSLESIPLNTMQRRSPDSMSSSESMSFNSLQRRPNESLSLTYILAAPLLQLFRQTASSESRSRSQEPWPQFVPVPKSSTQAAVAALGVSSLQRSSVASFSPVQLGSWTQPLAQVLIARSLSPSVEPFTLLRSHQSSIIARKPEHQSSSRLSSQIQPGLETSQMPGFLYTPSQELVQPSVEGSRLPFTRQHEGQNLSSFLVSQPLIQARRFELGSSIHPALSSSFIASRSTQGVSTPVDGVPHLTEYSADLPLPAPVHDRADSTFASDSASDLQQPLIQPSRSSIYAPSESSASMELLTPISTVVSRMLESGDSSSNQEQQIQVSQNSESNALAKKISPEQIQWLARQVYTRLRRQMLIELERLGRR